MHFSRSGEEDHFLIVYAFDGFDVVDLGDTHGDGPGLVEDDRVDVGQVFDVVAALDEDSLAGCHADSCRDGRRCRQFQAAREVDEQEVEDALPVFRGPVDDGCADEGDGNQEVGHLIGKVLDRRPAGLGFFDEVDDLGQGRVGADLFDADDQVARFDDAARIDRRFFLLNSRIGFARNGGLVDGGIAADDAAVDADLFAQVDGDEVAPLQRFDRDLAFMAVFDEPDVALVQFEEARNLTACLFGSVFGHHFGPVRQSQEGQARFGLAGQDGRSDCRRRQGIGIGLMVLYEPHDAVLNVTACNI